VQGRSFTIERLFLLWLVLVLFRRADAGAASASSSPG
jgi:hypothetical protein